MYIAQIGLDQKQSVVQTQNDWSVAKMENAKAEADYNQMTQQLTVVRNDRQKAKLEQDSAASNKKSADASGDTNKMNDAQKQLRGAELAVKAADARVKYYEAYRGYLKKWWRYTQENMYWREAQYELAKAQLAQKNNIQPKGVTFESFTAQEQERNRRAQTAKQKADGEKTRATTARESWIAAQSASDSANGRQGNLPDPMATPAPSTTAGPAPAPTPTPTP